MFVLQLFAGLNRESTHREEEDDDVFEDDSVHAVSIDISAEVAACTSEQVSRSLASQPSTSKTEIDMPPQSFADASCQTDISFPQSICPPCDSKENSDHVVSNSLPQTR